MDLSVESEIAEAAKNLMDDAIQNIGDRLPDDDDKQKFLARMQAVGENGMQAIIDGEDYRQHLAQGAYETSIWLANHYTDSALREVSSRFPPGQTKDKIFDAIQQISRSGIEGFCRGETKSQIRSRLANVTTNLVSPYAQNLANDLGRNMYQVLKTHGSGSRKINRYIKGGTNAFASEFGTQLVVNLKEVLSGRNNLGDAIGDVAINSATNSVVNYTKQEGEKIAEQALKSLAAEAEKKLGQTLAVDTLKKFANSNAIITTAGAIYDIGKDFNLLIGGKISGREFVTQVTEKGIDIVVQNVATVLGTMIGSAIGAPVLGTVIGSVINYFASSFLNGVVNQIRSARAEVIESRKRYEFIHAFCEYQIQKLESERIEFERRISEFLSNRQHVIDVSLAEYESALLDGNFERISSALNDICVEFGGSLQFKTMKEFDDFMLDDSQSFQLYCMLKKLQINVEYLMESESVQIKFGF